MIDVGEVLEEASGAGVVWSNADGSFSPACPVCEWIGKGCDHTKAAARVREHVCGNGHRAALARHAGACDTFGHATRPEGTV